MAAHDFLRRPGLELRPDVAAALLRHGTAIDKAATRAHAAGERWPSRHRGGHHRLLQPGDRQEEPADIGMRRLLQHLARRALEHELPCVHDGDAVADSCDGAEIVAHIDHRRPGFGREVPQQLEDMGLRRDVEAGRRLVEQQHIRLARQRHGDRDSLLLTARELVGVARQQFLGLRKAHLPQQLDDARPPRLPCETGVQGHRLLDLPANPRSRRQRLAGILRDQGELTAADALKGVLVHLEHIAPAKQGFAFEDAEAPLQVTQHGKHQGALAAPRFADQSNRFALADREIDVAQNRQYVARLAGKADAKVVHSDQRFAHRPIRRTI